MNKKCHSLTYLFHKKMVQLNQRCIVSYMVDYLVVLTVAMLEMDILNILQDASLMEFAKVVEMIVVVVNSYNHC